ncbi:hypothetical protein KKB40_02885 [Patescibacteria group bacterium]|nr:hypothetical protein [Patescibacteria group bacterium]
MRTKLKNIFDIHIDNTVLMTILVSVFFIIFLVIIFKQGFFKLDDPKQNEQRQVIQKPADEDLSLEKYFDKLSQDSKNDNASSNSLPTDSENCILFGKNVKGGTVNSNTTCISEPKQ